jgi:fructose-1,6-bisphosphatase/inositol monophosphatase family enzyme
VGGEGKQQAEKSAIALLREHREHEKERQLLAASIVLPPKPVLRSNPLLDQIGRGTCWIIDPLDGTGNFARGAPPFGMLVALADHGVPVAGWILDPLSGRLCHARRGGGAWIDGESFVTPSAPAGARPKVAVTRLFANAQRRQHLLRPIFFSGRFKLTIRSPLHGSSGLSCPGLK